MNISESLDRILHRSDTLADLFYLVFLERYPQVQDHFRGVDMKRQNLLLTMSLIVVERHYLHGYAATTAYLEMLGRQHKQRGVGRELYPFWRDALLAALERFHSNDWNKDLAAQWRAALDQAIDGMTRVYR
jgi:hemoglobin-like flavoprotein